MGELIHGDAIEEVADIEKNSVDLLLTDPPYNISTEFEMERGRSYAGSNISHDFGDWDKGDVKPTDWLPLMMPLMTEESTVIIFYDYSDLGEVTDAMKDCGLNIRQPVVFSKDNPAPMGFPVKWQEGAEIGYIATTNEGRGDHVNANHGQRSNVIESAVCSGDERRDHPTQKPEDLIYPIVKWWSHSNDTVFDPFMGVGTIPAVSLKLGRDYIGIEKDDAYFAEARKRLAGVEPNYNVGETQGVLGEFEP